MRGSIRGWTFARWLAFVGVAFGLSLVTLPWLAGERAGLMEDDSYFYAQIAFNWATRGLPSFDGLHPTSGFHLLWQGVLLAVAGCVSVLTDDKAVHLAAYTAAWLSMVGFVSRSVGQTTLQRLVFFALALVTAPLMETALLCLILLFCMNALAREGDGPGFDVGFCLAAFLLPLTRIDMAPIGLLWCLFARGRPRLLGSLALGLALGVATHFAFLEAFFGHPYTVSSLLKAKQLGSGVPLRAAAKSGIAVRAGLLFLLVAWAFCAWRAAGRKDPMRSALLVGGPIAFSLGHLLVSDMRSWYFLPGFAAAFLVGTGGGALPRVRAWLTATSAAEERRLGALARLAWLGTIGAALLLTGYKLYRFVPLDAVRRASWEFVAEARRVVPPAGRLYQVDGSGFVGYWIERPLLNGDGLVNTYAYARRMKAHRLAGYLDEQGICYVITDAPLGERYLVRRGGLEVERSDAVELLRSTAFGWSRNPNAHFVLWRLALRRCAT